jgi:hypothetical protein
MEDNKKETSKMLLPSQYIFYLLMFVVKNKELFKLNSEIRHIGTRCNNDLH